MRETLARAALIVVDIQNDFCPDGALPVADGQEVVEVANRYMERFRDAGRSVFLSRDWHPAVTRHFAAYGGVWPPHCVQGTPGAAFHAALHVPPAATIVSKGADPEEDAYSAFQARGEDGRLLASLLRDAEIGRLFVGGLATDYCVRATVLDGLREGFVVTVLLDASRGVNLQPHDAELALQELVAAGASVATFGRLSD